MKYKSYSSTEFGESFDAIIIGSGMSGLCCGTLLAQKGKKVLLIEKHFKPGGYTHTFKRNEYEWDVGIHYIGDVHKKNNASRKLLDHISDGRLEWHKMDNNYDTIIFPDKRFNFVSPKEQFIENLINWFPKEDKAINRYMSLLDEVTRKSIPYYKNKALPSYLSTIMRPFQSNPYFALSDKTTYEVITNLSSDKNLLGLLTGQWGDYGLPPKQSSFVMHAGVVKHYLDGGNYPIGGSGKIAESILKVIRKLGGDICVSSGVKEILIQKNKAVGVQLESGEKIHSPLVISSAGVMNTYGKLLNSDLTGKLKNKLKTVTKTDGHLCLYIGMKGSPKDLGLSTTNLWIYPSYDHDKNVNQYLEDRNRPFPVLYLSFPSTKDPEKLDSSPNRTTMEAITLAPFSWFEKWKDQPWKNRGEDYESMKEQFCQRMFDQIFLTLPQLKNKIDYYELSTPLSTKSMMNYDGGELYGLEHTPSRFRQRWLRPQTPVQGLFLTGQDITTVGLTGALFSGLLTCSSILKKNLYKEII